MYGNRFGRWQAVQKRITANDPKQRLKQEELLHRTFYILLRSCFALFTAPYPATAHLRGQSSQKMLFKASPNSIQYLKTHLVLKKISENFPFTHSLPSGWGRHINRSYGTKAGLKTGAEPKIPWFYIRLLHVTISSKAGLQTSAVQIRIKMVVKTYFWGADYQ